MADRRTDIINGYFKSSGHIFGDRPPVVSDRRVNDRGTFYILDTDFVVTPHILNDVKTHLGASIGRFDFDDHSTNNAPRMIERTALFFSDSFDPMALPLPWPRIFIAGSLMVLFAAVYVHYNAMKEIYDI